MIRFQNSNMSELDGNQCRVALPRLLNDAGPNESQTEISGGSNDKKGLWLFRFCLRVLFWLPTIWLPLTKCGNVP
jgi:hypothetical protein